MRGQTLLNIRPVEAQDLEFLEAMLWEAFFWNATAERPAFSAFRLHPEFTKLLSGWGRQGDWGAIAEDGGRPLGALLIALIGRARVEGFPALSLSVDPSNPSRSLYESLGFQKVGESETSWTYRLPLE